MIHVVTSPHGGVFSVFVDGFDTASTIDTCTFSANNTQRPLCYPAQFPPFVVSPPSLGSQNHHSITLIYMGPSPYALNDTTPSNVQFDSFGIPDFKPTSSKAGTEKGGLLFLTFLISMIVACCMAGTIDFWVI